MTAIVGDLVEAGDGGPQEDLLAVNDLQGGREVFKHFLRQCLHGVVQIVEVVDMVVGVNVPAAHHGGKALRRCIAASSIGAEIFREHSLGVQGVGGAYRF